jgi:hypothetical protein
MDDTQYTDGDGHVTVRNDTHRKCLAENCTFLAYCEISFGTLQEDLYCLIMQVVVGSVNSA